MIETYAAFVWPSYGITAAVFVLNWWLARRRHAVELKAAQRRQQTTAEETR